MEHEMRNEINKFRDFLKENSEEKLNISDVRGSSYDEDSLKWGEIFDDMKTSPYIDIKNVRESDRIAILSWLSSNFHAPVKRDKQQWG